MNIVLDIDCSDERWNEVFEDLDGFAFLVAKAALGLVPELYKFSDHELELSFVFTDDSEIQDLNRDFRGKDKPTNVLSFPQIDWDDDMPLIPVLNLGDNIMAFETIEREAQEQQKSIHDHTAHMLVHGVLHLCGYDHIQNDEAERMEALEVKILHELGINNPYEDETDG